jgi:hypothetical protein
MNITRIKVIAASALVLLGAGLVIANAVSRNYVDKPHNSASQSATVGNADNKTTTTGVYLVNAPEAISQADKLCSARWVKQGLKILPTSKGFFLRKTATGEVQGTWVCGPVKEFGSATVTGFFDMGSWVVTQTPAGLTFAATVISQTAVSIPADMLTWRPDGSEVSSPDLLSSG